MLQAEVQYARARKKFRIAPQNGNANVNRLALLYISFAQEKLRLRQKLGNLANYSYLGKMLGVCFITAC